MDLCFYPRKKYTSYPCPRDRYMLCFSFSFPRSNGIFVWFLMPCGCYSYPSSKLSLCAREELGRCLALALHPSIGGPVSACLCHWGNALPFPLCLQSFLWPPMKPLEKSFWVSVKHHVSLASSYSKLAC